MWSFWIYYKRRIGGNSGVYHDCQHVFVNGRSALTNLIETLESSTRILEEGNGIDVTYLDYRKAFDTVSHKRLIDEVRETGVNSYRIIMTFCRRYQTVGQVIQFGRQWFIAARLSEVRGMAKDVAIGFNPEKCKVMHIVHRLSTSYNMEDGDRVKDMNITTEKDLRIGYLLQEI